MKKLFLVPFMLGLIAVSCSNDDSAASEAVAKDIDKAEKVSVDRFSANVGHLQVRTATNGLPESNEPVNFDQEPFITTGLGRTGTSLSYYNFDVQPVVPIPIYVFFKADGVTPVAGQNNIVSFVPGDAKYSDFWLVQKVIATDNYVANSITSEVEVLASKFKIISTDDIVNCPVVPFGSTANRSDVAGEASKLTIGWYNGKAVAYFNFPEPGLKIDAQGLVPTSPIYVMFNIDPSDSNPASGPASGFMHEPGSVQTHNVLGTPEGVALTPLWDVRVLSNVNFNAVTNLETALSFPSVKANADVNCPVVR